MEYGEFKWKCSLRNLRTNSIQITSLPHRPPSLQPSLCGSSFLPLSSVLFFTVIKEALRNFVVLSIRIVLFSFFPPLPHAKSLSFNQSENQSEMKGNTPLSCTLTSRIVSAGTFIWLIPLCVCGVTIGTTSFIQCVFDCRFVWVFVSL